MLAKKEIIDICNSLNLNSNKYCLGFGGALVLYGIKESTSDIDIYVTIELFNILSQKYKVDYATFGEPYIIIDGVVDIFIGCNIGEKTYIDGIPVSTLKEIIESKKRLGRPKDKKDIKCIEEFISNSK
jgi:hypothetical protein